MDDYFESYGTPSTVVLCPEGGLYCDEVENYSYFGNDTWLNTTDQSEGPGWSSIAVTSITSIMLALLILATIVGNVFVIVAVFFEKNLQNVANYLVVSLAVADLMVACLVMPLAAVYEISGKWLLGPVGCDFWLTADVLCCSASILHLLSVALDRYWAVTNIEYIRSRNKTRIFTMIFLVWFLAALVSVAPLFGWKDPLFLQRIEKEQQCLVSQDMGYQIFATCSTFYVPLFFILLLYWKIWKAARHRIRHRVGKIQKTVTNNSVAVTATPTPSKMPSGSSQGNLANTPPSTSAPIRSPGAEEETKNIGRSTTFSDELSCHTGTVETSTDSIGSPQGGEDQEMETIPSGPSTTVAVIDVEQAPIPLTISCASPPPRSSSNNGSKTDGENNTVNQKHSPPENSKCLSPNAIGKSASPTPQTLQVPGSESCCPSPSKKAPKKSKEQKKKETLEAKRERKAATTLAIITGAFVICWLPFFIMALGLAVCQSCLLPDYVISAFQWLGYVNSSINPVLYTVNPAFRQAFKKILCGHRQQRRW